MLSALLLVLLVGLPSAGQSWPAEWQDDLVDRMTGAWRLEGMVLGAAAHRTVIADWVLNHQFLRIPEDTASSGAAFKSRYEAFWFIAYGPVSERYVTHLLGAFGARFSQTLGLRHS